MPVLELKNLSKRYGDVTAVDGISFSVQKNEIVGLLGPNGAGKTTTINMILGVLEPTNGSITIEGIDVLKDPKAALVHTNFAAVYAQLPGNLTVAQNLYVFSLLYSVKNISKRIAEVVEEFDLKRFFDTKAGLLSSGEQTRLSLAKALLNTPKLLLLDEPTASLDPSTARTTRETIRAYSRSGDAGILWTSHNMYEVEDVCDRVLFLSHGKILLEGDPKKLPPAHGVKNLEELFIKVARQPLSVDTE
jgi:ABC-2 type transport system ATP-binding protein